MKTFALIVGVLLGLLAFVYVRQSHRRRDFLLSLSSEDRKFIADQLEPFTLLPIRSAEDEAIWWDARDATFERLRERVPEFVNEILPVFLPFFNDADVFRREPDYRAAQKSHVVDLIHELRKQSTRT